MDTKELPHNTEAEQSVLGAIMRDQSLLPTARASLTADDFFEHYHRAIWGAITELADSSAEYDAVSVGDRVDPQVAQYAVGITADTYTTSGLSAHIEIVRRAAAKRRQIDIGRELISRGFNCAEPEDIAAYGIAELAGIARQFDAADDHPMDVFGDEEVPALKPEWLPPGIAEFSIDQSKIAGTPSEFVAMNCIGAICSVLHDDFRVAPQKNSTGFDQRACLWIMTVAGPGSNKSAAFERATGPVKRINSLIGAKYAAEMAGYEPRLKEHMMRQKDQMRRKVKGEGFEEDASPPERPINHRIVVNDATTESLSQLFMDNQRGLTYMNDELSSWFGTFDAYRSGGGPTKDRPLALHAYEGGPRIVDRVSGTVSVPNWSYSVIGTIQPDKIREIAKGSSDDGLMQRFMIVESDAKDLMPDYRHVENARLTQDYEDTINAIYKLKPNGPSRIPMSEEAYAAFEEFDHWVRRMSSNAAISPALAGAIPKYSGRWARLALVYHVWGCVRAGRHPMSMALTERTAQRVTALCKHYLIPHAMRFYAGTLGEANPVQNLVRAGASMILGDSLTTITLRDLARGTAAWRNATDWQRKAAIGQLRDSGWLRAGGSDAWVVAPRVHAQYAQRAIKENARRREAAQLMKELRDAARGG